jgi:hypothetical protein
MPDKDLGTLIKEMDKLNMKVMVNLSGRSGNSIVQSAKNIRDNYPKRFIVFANVNFTGVGEKDWGEKAAKQLEEDVKNGANGLCNLFREEVSEFGLMMTSVIIFRLKRDCGKEILCPQCFSILSLTRWLSLLQGQRRMVKLED